MKSITKLGIEIGVIVEIKKIRNKNGYKKDQSGLYIPPKGRGQGISSGL